MINIFSLFKKNDKPSDKLIKYNNITFIEKETNHEFLQVIPDNNYDNQELIRVGDATKINMVLQQLPLVANIAQSKELQGAYKVVFPEGVTGTLMKYKNGLLGTPMVGEKGKTVAHAGLELLDASKVLQPVMIFSAMSLVTGQYFMARIDKSLSTISKDVKEIIELIYDEKESDIYAIYDYYEYIKNNMDTIIENEPLKVAVLSNIELNNNKMNSNIKFYTKSIRRKIVELDNVDKDSIFTSKRLDKVEELENKIQKLMHQQSLCYELFCLGKIIEVKVAEIYNNNYYENTINEFKNLGKEIEENIDNLMKVSNDILLKTKKGAVLNQEKVLDKIFESNNKYKERKETLENNIASLINNINMFVLDSVKEKEFYVIGNDLYTKVGV